MLSFLCYLPNACVIKFLTKNTINMSTFIFKIQGRWFTRQIEKPGKTFLWNPTNDINLCFLSLVWQNGNTAHICKGNKVIKKKWYKLLSISQMSKGDWCHHAYSLDISIAYNDLFLHYLPWLNRDKLIRVMF